jgi:hypothetical protein
MDKSLRSKYSKAFGEVFNKQLPKSQRIGEDGLSDMQRQILEAAREAAKALPDGAKLGSETVDSGKKLFFQIGKILLAEEDQYACMMATSQALSMVIASMADLDPDNPEEKELVEEIGGKVMKMTGELMAMALVKTKNPAKLMEFVKMSLSKLKGADGINEIIKECEDLQRKQKGEQDETSN